jgi:hypothetical protein
MSKCHGHLERFDMTEKQLKGSTSEICCKKPDERPQLSVRNENPFDEGIAFVIGINERFLKRMLPA